MRQLPLLITAAGLAGRAQSANVAAAGFCLPDAGAVMASAALMPVHMVREINDPNTGTHWLILPNQKNPAGPGRMVLGPEVRRRAQAAQAEKIAPAPVIHRGDPVVVEEHSRVVEASLEGVARGPAMVGSSFDVRLKIGGRVVRAVAIAPGRAALMPPEVEP